METPEDRNVYQKYTKETIDKWINWLDNIPSGADPADSALWYASIGDFSRDANVIFKDRTTGKPYISPDHFEKFLNKYFPNANSYFHLKFADIKRKMDQEVGERLERMGQGGSKRKRKSKSKSKRKSQRKSQRKSKRKSNKKSKRMH